LVDSAPFVQRAVDSNPAQAATYRDLEQVLHSQLPVALRRVNSVMCQERLWVVVDLKSRYINSLNECMSEQLNANLHKAMLIFFTEDKYY